MSLLDDIGNHLIGKNIVNGSTGWKLYLGFTPDSPSRTVTISETGGPAPDQTSGTRHEMPTFQVRVRGDVRHDYVAARAKMKDVVDTLRDPRIAIGDDPGSPQRDYVFIFPAQSGILSFVDQNERPNMTVNFTTMRPI